MMSNCLYILLLTTTAVQKTATQPAAQIPENTVPPLLVWVTATGICALAIWIVRKIANPSSLTLANTPRRDNILTPIHAGIPIAGWILSLAFAGWLFGFWLDKSSPKLLILTSIVGQIAWIVFSILVCMFSFSHGLVRGMGLSLRRWKYDSAKAAIAYLTCLPACIGLLIATSLVLPEDSLEIHQLLEPLLGLKLIWKVLVIISAVVLAPVSEELFFRGIVQSMLRKYLGKPWPAVIVTSILFGLLHYDTPQNVPALILFGAVLGYVYERSGRLYPAILTHALFNAVTIASLLLNPELAGQ